jgi:predicted acylesterase/phospholipase RssA
MLRRGHGEADVGAAGYRRVAIACQGGGHTAFTAGALARLFEDELDEIEMVGLSGTSDGAVCALLASHALRSDGPLEVGPLLERFWADNSATTAWEQLLNAGATFAGDPDPGPRRPRRRRCLLGRSVLPEPADPRAGRARAR